MSPDELRAAIAEHDWYHTIELADGVVTPGWMDTREVARRLPFPASLRGQRCLDVGTFDGAWALELERRGADEVVGIDVLDPRQWDWPGTVPDGALDQFDKRKAAGSGFELVMRTLNSKVVRQEASVYQLTPERFGTFDFVYVGSLLLHLRDPIGALMAVRSVCRGQLLLVDQIDIRSMVAPSRRPKARLDGIGRPWWWTPNLAGLVRMVEAAGFEVTGKPDRFRMPIGPGRPRPPFRWYIIRDRQRRGELSPFYSEPHAAILARPA